MQSTTRDPRGWRNNLYDLLALLSLFWCPMPAAARNKISDNQERDENHNIGEHQDNLIRLQVTYKTPWGATMAEACAEQVLDHRRTQQEMILYAKENCLSTLQSQSEHIMYAEYDLYVEAKRLGRTIGGSGSGSSNPPPTTPSETNLYFNWKNPMPDLPINKFPEPPQTPPSPPISVSYTESIPYGMAMIQADAMDLGPYNVSICIADTGIELDHPDIDPIYITGEDTVQPWGEVWKWDQDRVGHGTQIAGLLAATRDNDMGIAGLLGRGSNLRLHIVRALNDEGVGYDSDTVSTTLIRDHIGVNNLASK